MDFAALPNDEQIARLQQLAHEALLAWGITDAQTELIKYRENAVFAVNCPPEARYVLRIHRPRYRTDQHIRSELRWMHALAETGVHTPAIVRTRTGDLLTVAATPGIPEPRQCDLLSWVEGQPLGSLESGIDMEEAALQRTYQTVGEIAARIHAHGRAWDRPSDFARRPWDTEALVGEHPTFGRFWELDLLTDDQRKTLFRARDRARERLEAFGQDPARYGLIHGDLVPDNILAGPAGVRVVDFDDCGNSWYAFELATSIFALFGSPGFAPARDGYLEGYRRVRALPDEDLTLMPTFLMARGLSYLGWPAGRKEMQSGRDLAPLLVVLISEIAEQYLSDQL